MAARKKKALTSETLSCRLLERAGWEPDICTRRLGKFIAKDLYGIFDIVADHELDPYMLGVQATTRNNRASHIKTLTEDKLKSTIKRLRRGWRVQMHLWDPPDIDGYRCTIVEYRLGLDGELVPAEWSCRLDDNEDQIKIAHADFRRKRLAPIGKLNPPDWAWAC